MKKIISVLAMALLPLAIWAQFGVVAPLHVNGNQLNDQYGNKVVLHGVMDTPSPYFNKNRWGYTCTDNNVTPCINYYDKVFGALQNPAKGTYCNIFRLHLEPGWTTPRSSRREVRPARPTSRVSALPVCRSTWTCSTGPSPRKPSTTVCTS